MEEEDPTEATPLKSKKDAKATKKGQHRRTNSVLQRSYPHRYIARHEPTLEDYNTSTKSDNVNRALFQMAMRWSLIKSFCSLITLGGVCIIVLTVISTMVCYHYDFEAALPLAFLGTGIFFPISFGYLRACITVWRCALLNEAAQSSWCAAFRGRSSAESRR